MSEIVAIIGASEKPVRYANKAMHALERHGHDVVLVNPTKSEVEGRNCLSSVCDYSGAIDTVTLYVNPRLFSEHIHEVISVKPKRVIMNPGTECKDHEHALRKVGIRVQKACTLVLLLTGQFDK